MIGSEAHETCVIWCQARPVVKYDSDLGGHVCSDCLPAVEVAGRVIRLTPEELNLKKRKK